VIYEGINHEIFKPVPHEERLSTTGDHFLFVGASYPHKNLSGVVKAYQAISSPKPKLIVVGGRKVYLDGIRREIREDGVEGVEFKNYMSDKELRLLYARAVCLVFPSFYEGFGLPPLEAMACECPVIASHASSLPEVCSDAALYVNPENVQEIKKGMEAFLHDRFLRDSFIARGLLQVEKFSWSDAGRLTLQILIEAARERTKK
jgi:glycosyltransferase involved in cell wall biosynthesis